ncbi:hypothetical protein GS501_04610 [Saccharibacter sp. 17.LH.SD]|uniref:hypothetical protein n=1 Tax=Saccharibacter sp. 17.LH.SD TaxID=2689393 RepID=UPI0013710FD7|nr:hypothetical protein [Saccharibacter sp. 17.LH.SD]MXV44327.1 hypothetical protein [Saccharibacter sp. 17.LH.SD]
MSDTPPTIEGFESFVRTVMQVPMSAMPTHDELAFAFDLAKDLALPDIQCISLRVYKAALYNLAASNLIQFSQDQPQSATPRFWKNLRLSLGMNSFTPGLIASSSDGGTSQSWSIPNTLKDLSLADLQTLKNPYGQFYLSLAQQFGSIWTMV